MAILAAIPCPGNALWCGQNRPGGNSMQINPPFGYSEIVPLYKNQKVRLPAPGALPEFCRKVNAVPISYSEFAVACRDYPLAFITTDQSKAFLPVAVLGVTGGENLFLRDGQ